MASALEPTHPGTASALIKLLFGTTLLLGALTPLTSFATPGWTVAPTPIIAGTNTTYSYNTETATLRYIRWSLDGVTWTSFGANPNTVTGSYSFPNPGTYYIDISTNGGNQTSAQVAGTQISITATRATTFTVSPTTFYYNGTSQGPTITQTPTGTYTTTGTATAVDAATYSVTANATSPYTGTSGVISWTINKINANTPTVSASANPGMVGSPTTFTPNNGTTSRYGWTINGTQVSTYNGSAWSVSSGSFASGSWSISGLNLIITPSSTATYTVIFTDLGNINYNAVNSATHTETVNPAPINNAQFISQTVPATVTSGQTFSVTQTWNNNGTKTWTTGTQYFLGSQNPQDNSTWGTGRYAQTGTVAPGANQAYTFNITAPATPGTYNFQSRLVQDGVEWFGGYSSNVAITVNPIQVGTTTTVAAISARTYSASTQNLPVSATVSGSPTASGGTVTFTFRNSGGTAVASTSGTVASGAASGTITIPAGTAVAAGYYVSADYAGSSSGNYTWSTSSGNSAAFAINPLTVGTTTTVAGISARTYSASTQNLPVSATVSGSPTASGGTVTFTFRNSGGTAIASTTGTVTSGAASGTITIPAGTAVAAGYYVSADYAGSSTGNYTWSTSSGNGATFAINPLTVSTTTTVASISARTYSASAQSLPVSATVSGSPTASGGTVTFTFRNSGGTAVASTTGTVTSGAASGTITIPAGTAVAAGYYVSADYAGSSSGNYTWSTSSGSSAAFAINAAADTTPPVLSTGLPTGQLAAGTTQATLTLTTNENATIRYSTTSGVTYASMTNTFTTTGGASHSTVVTGLTNGSTYTYYVRGIDTATNATTTDYPITFSVALPADTTPPVLSAGLPTGQLAAGTTQATLTLTTNENATIRYSTTSGVAYASMTNTFTTTGGTSHSTVVTGLTNGSTYTYYVRGIDPATNATTTDYPITFSVATPANTAPTITSVANQTTTTALAVGPLSFTIGDTQTAAASLTMTGSSSNTTLVPNANIVFGGSGASRTVTVTPAASQIGTATITLTVNDGTLATSTTFTLTVSTNTAPTITSVANQTTATAIPVGPLNFTIGDSETAAASLNMTGSSSNTPLVPNGNIVFGGSGANRTVTVTPAVSQTGTATITLTVSDGTLTTSTTFTLTVNTSTDTIAPYAPPGLTTSSRTETSFTLSWSASTDNVGVTAYEVFRDGVSQGTTASLSMVQTGLAANTIYVMRVRARDAAGNWSNYSTRNVYTDVTLPSVPAGLVATNKTTTSFTLNWTASTDNMGISAYQVYLNGVSQGTTSSLFMAQTGLTPGTTYSMRVRARDDAGNYSDRSTTFNVTTLVVNADSDGDGILDGWELQYLTTIAYGANEDPFNVGRTILQSYQQSLSPLPAATVAAGLRAWYRADAGIIKDVNNKVSTWGDFSGHGFHAQQNSAAWWPNWTSGAINGQPALSFASNQQLRTNLVDLQSGGNDVTVITVLKPASTQEGAAAVLDFEGGYRLRQEWAVTNQYELYWLTNPGDVNFNGRQAMINAAANQTQVLTVIKNGTTQTAYLNGATQNSQTVSALMYSPATGRVGLAGTGNDYEDFAGQIAEVLVYNRALTTTERQQVESALIAKYITPPALPSITSATTATGQVGVAFSYQITATNTPTSYNATGLPAGLSVSTGTGLISGTPTTAATSSVTLSATNVAGTGTATLSLTVNPATTAPTITTQPAALQTVTAGASVTFTAAASGTPTPTYQWQKNGTNIPGATNASYTITNTVVGDAGTYRMVATNVAGTATSNNSVLTVNVPPAITTQPAASQTVTAGASVTFTAAASGTPTPTYQWQKTGTNIPGATNAIYTIAGTTTGDAGTYRMIATNVAGTATSNNAVLTVNAATTAPTITTQPAASQTVIAGQAASFTVVATGSPAPTYQWKKNGTAIGGATGTTYTISATVAGDAATYTVTVTNVAGNVTSNNAVLTVNAALATLPYTTDFETAQGYVAGTLQNQLGWSITQGAAVVTTLDHVLGAQCVQLSSGSPVATITQTFANSGGQTVEFFDFFAKPVAETSLASASTFTVEGARFAFLLNGSQGILQAYNGNGSGGGTWQATTVPFAITVNASHQAQSWVRLTARLDFTTKKWDLYADNTMVAADIPFINNASTYLATFQVQGDTTAVSGLDDIYAGPTNPLFADTNFNGILDSWETGYGLSLGANNRNTSPTSNGVTVIQAYVGGTNPNDFYNSAAPTLIILGGNNQVGLSGQFNPLDFDVAVRKTVGLTALVNAPVTFTVQSGGGKLSVVNTGTPTLATLNLNTDSLGTASVYYQQPATPGVQSQILFTAGTAQATFLTNTLVDMNIGGLLNLTDSDGDGLPDLWEILHFGSIAATNSITDSDGDGLNNGAEYIAGTNPMVNESTAVLPADTQVVVRIPSGSYQKVKTDWSILAAP